MVPVRSPQFQARGSTPLLADAAVPWRQLVGDRWYVHKTYVKVAGRSCYVYRAVDQHGRIIDLSVSACSSTHQCLATASAKLTDS